MKLPRLIQRALDMLPRPEDVMEEEAAKDYALTLVECLGCGGASGLFWMPTLDGPEIHCMRCFNRGGSERIVRKRTPVGAVDPVGEKVTG